MGLAEVADALLFPHFIKDTAELLELKNSNWKERITNAFLTDIGFGGLQNLIKIKYEKIPPHMTDAISGVFHDLIHKWAYAKEGFEVGLIQISTQYYGWYGKLLTEARPDLFELNPNLQSALYTPPPSNGEPSYAEHMIASILPHIILPLVGTPLLKLGKYIVQNYENKLVKGLGRFIGGIGIYLITSPATDIFFSQSMISGVLNGVQFGNIDLSSKDMFYAINDFYKIFDIQDKVTTGEVVFAGIATGYIIYNIGSKIIDKSIKIFDASQSAQKRAY